MISHAITISGMVAVAEDKPLLLERDAELARLSALLGRAQAGSGAEVAIGGPAGSRRTAQLAAAAPGARRLPPPGRPGAGGGAGSWARGDAPASEFAAVHVLYWLSVNLADRQPL